MSESCEKNISEMREKVHSLANCLTVIKGNIERLRRDDSLKDRKEVVRIYDKSLKAIESIKSLRKTLTEDS